MFLTRRHFAALAAGGISGQSLFGAFSAKLAKGLIVLGHTISEDPGMDEAADWLRTIVTEVPAEFIPAGEPFWTVE